LLNTKLSSLVLPGHIDEYVLTRYGGGTNHEETRQENQTGECFKVKCPEVVYI